MQLDALAHALGSNARSHLGRTARTLGHALPTAKFDTLEAFRTMLEEVPAQDDPFVDGYLRALADLAVAVQRELAPEQAAREIAQGLTEPRRQALRELADGPALVGELAERMGKTEGAVSKQLSSMRSDGLVEVTSAENDQRKRPHRLTPLGRRVAAELPPPSLRPSGLVVDKNMLRAIEVSVLALATVVQAGQVRWELAEQLVAAGLGDPRLERKWARMLRRISLQTGLLAAHEDQVLALPELERLLDADLRAMVLRRDSIDRLFGAHAERLPRDSWLWVRASGWDVAAWRALADSADLGPFRGCRVLAGTTAELFEAQREQEPPVLLYDGTTTAHADLALQPRLKELTPYLFCVSAPGQTVPSPFTPLTLPAA